MLKCHKRIWLGVKKKTCKRKQKQVLCVDSILNYAFSLKFITKKKASEEIRFSMRSNIPVSVDRVCLSGLYWTDNKKISHQTSSEQQQQQFRLRGNFVG